MSTTSRSIERRLSIWLKPEDLVKLVRIGLEHPDIRFKIFYGASNNADGWWDNSNARRFGYCPQGRSEDTALKAMAEQARLRLPTRSATVIRAALSARMNITPRR